MEETTWIYGTARRLEIHCSEQKPHVQDHLPKTPPYFSPCPMNPHVQYVIINSMCTTCTCTHTVGDAAAPCGRRPGVYFRSIRSLPLNSVSFYFHSLRFPFLSLTPFYFWSLRHLSLYLINTWFYFHQEGIKIEYFTGSLYRTHWTSANNWQILATSTELGGSLYLLVRLMWNVSNKDSYESLSIFIVSFLSNW